MTQKTIELIYSLMKRNFDPQQTMEVLTHNRNTYWSWGVSSACNMDNKALVLKVNGHHHKGYVVITLDWMDTYIVNIISTHGTLKDTYENVYVDELVTRIDDRIEKIDEYIR
jgi:hypothetical protein